jgi:hypothetical protein
MRVFAPRPATIRAMFAVDSGPVVLTSGVALFGLVALVAGGRLVRSGQPMDDRPNWLRILAGSFVGVIGMLALLVAFVLGTCAMLAPH